MDKFAIKSASQRIEYWLKIDPEPFSKLKEQISDLQNVLEKTLDLLEDGDCRTTTEEADEIKSIANDVEDVFDTFIYNFRSVHNSYGVAKISATILNNLSLNILRNKIESIQHRLVVMLDGKREVGFVCSQLSSHTGQSSKDADDEYIVGLEADAENMIPQLITKLECEYMNLGYNLKACFLYLGVFPCMYEIHAGVYRRMWMAEGFGGNDSEEEVMEYLEELSRRYLIRILERNLEGRIKIIQVPSLIYEFCITKAREENFLDIDSQQFDASSFNSQDITSRSRWCKKSEDSYIRSLSVFHYQAMDNRIRIGAIYKNLKLLRVLTLWGILTSGKSLPDEIELLVHLTYLGIRDTNIDKLPDSIGNLKNLLTLDWRGVYPNKSIGNWRKLPDGIWKMVQLRHLYVRNIGYMNSFKLFNLNNLYTLWGIGLDNCLVEGGKSWNFPNLRKLYLYYIYSTDQLDTIFDCFKTTPNLRKLKLDWSGYSSKVKLQSIDQLYEHCRKLSVLILIGRIEKSVALQFPRNLIKLVLDKTKIEGYDPLVLIGNCCPDLKVLELRNEAYRGSTMRCRADAFQSLVELIVDDMDELETWVIETGALPCLEKLYLSRANKLARLPEGIRYITTLVEFILEDMPRQFCEKLVQMEQNHLTTVADKVKGEDFYIIQHIPNIKFIDIYG